MILKLLDNQEIEFIFYHHLIHDFPKNETRPLKSIYDLKEQKRYFCYGAYDHSQLVGYAFFTKSIHPNEFLMDYLAVVSKQRNKGYGSKIIQLIGKEFTNKIVFAEVESLESNLDLATLQLRKRRIHFYLRNGFKLSDVDSIVFSVHFNMIYLSSTLINSSVAYQKIDDLYLYLFGKDRYQKHIKVFKKEELH